MAIARLHLRKHAEAHHSLARIVFTAIVVAYFVLQLIANHWEGPVSGPLPAPAPIAAQR